VLPRPNREVRHARQRRATRAAARPWRRCRRGRRRITISLTRTPSDMRVADRRAARTRHDDNAVQRHTFTRRHSMGASATHLEDSPAWRGARRASEIS
jgi:hypothetical protein